MNLTPREKDKLLIAMAAIVARKRLERGVRLNHPEAVALITDFVVEDTEDLGGLFSGWDEKSRSYDPATWLYEGASKKDEEAPGMEDEAELVSPRHRR